MDVYVYVSKYVCMYVSMYGQAMCYDINTWLSITYNPKPDVQSDMLY